MGENTKLLGKIAGAFIALQTIFGFVGKPILDSYIVAKQKEFLNSATMKLYVKEAFKHYEENKKPSFRSTLAGKMDGVDKDEVASEFVKVWKKQKNIHKEIDYYHPFNKIDE